MMLDLDGEGAKLSLDRFRGGLIVLMTAGDFAAGVTTVPAWLKHAPDSRRQASMPVMGRSSRRRSS